MKILKLIKDVYFSSESLTEKDYQNSRKLFVYEGITARAIFVLATGAFLAGFAKYLGASDQLNGLLGGIPVLAGMIQVFSPIVLERLEKRKFLISFFSLSHRLLLGLMIFIPLIVKDTSAALTLIAITYFVSFLLISFTSPAVSGLLMDLTPEHIRGRYFGRRESFIVAISTVVTLFSGKVLDMFKQSGSEYTGFMAVSIIIIILAFANFYFISSVKEPPIKRSTTSVDIKSIITVPLKDYEFRKVIVLFMLWNIGLQIGGPFFAVYMVTGLKLKYSYIMFLGMLSSIANMITVRIWGRIADKKSWVYTTKMSIGLLAVIHACWFFVNEDTAFLLVPLLHVLSGVAWSGINISIFNIQFTFTPEDGRTIYIGFNAGLNALVGFASTLAGSALIGILSNLNFKLFGVLSVVNMQVVLGLSGVLLGVCAAYIHFFIKSNKRKS